MLFIILIHIIILVNRLRELFQLFTRLIFDTKVSDFTGITVPVRCPTIVTNSANM